MTRETEDCGPFLGLSTEAAAQDVCVHVTFLYTCVRQACMCVSQEPMET